MRDAGFECVRRTERTILENPHGKGDVVYQQKCDCAYCFDQTEASFGPKEESHDDRKED